MIASVFGSGGLNLSVSLYCADLLVLCKELFLKKPKCDKN